MAGSRKALEALEWRRVLIELSARVEEQGVLPSTIPRLLTALTKLASTGAIREDRVEVVVHPIVDEMGWTDLCLAQGVLRAAARAFRGAGLVEGPRILDQLTISLSDRADVVREIETSQSAPAALRSIGTAAEVVGRLARETADWAESGGGSGGARRD